jgi:hypothetical protein
MRVSLTASNSAGSATAASAATTVVTAVAGTTSQYCENTFSDDFETVYSTPSGLNANACPTVSGTLAGDFINQGTWSVGTSAIKNVAPPAPGSGSRAVKVSAAAGSNATWASQWRHIQLGADYYYGMMLYFPSGWTDPAPNSWANIGELGFHPFMQGPGGAGPLHLSAHGDVLKLSVSTGLRVPGTPPQYSNGGDYAQFDGSDAQVNLGGLSQWSVVPKGQMNTGVWHEIVLHVRWATDTTGVIQAWWRRKGDATWTKTIDQSGFPTLAWGLDMSGNFTWTPNNLNGVTTADTLGLYRDNSNSPADTYYLDAYRVNTSFSGVAATLP